MWHNVLMAHAAPFHPLPSSFDYVTVEAGLPLSAMTGFVAASGVELKDIYDTVIPARTLKHRRARREPLSRDESDKLARLARIFHQAVAVLGDAPRAAAWLHQPKHRFEGRTPMLMLRTEIGGRLVEEMLGQIQSGFFA